MKKEDPVEALVYIFCECCFGGPCPTQAGLQFWLACRNVCGCAVIVQSWVSVGDLGLAPVPTHHRRFLAPTEAAAGLEVNGEGERGCGVREPQSAGGLSGSSHCQALQSIPGSNGSPSPWPAGDRGGPNGLPGSVSPLPPARPVYSLGSCASPPSPCPRLETGSKKRGAAPAPQLRSTCLPHFPMAKPPVSSPRTCRGYGSQWPWPFSSLQSRSSWGKEGSRTCHLLFLAHPRRDAVPIAGLCCPHLTVCHPPPPTPKQGRGGCSWALSRKTPQGQLHRAPPLPSQELGCPGSQHFAEQDALKGARRCQQS